MAAGSHFNKKFQQKIKLISSEVARNAIESEIRIQNGRRQPFCVKMDKKIEGEMKWPPAAIL